MVFSAAAWQEGLVDVESYDRAFDWAFHRNADRTFVDAIRNLYHVHDLLRSAKAGIASNALFWRDPFSASGAEAVRKTYPVASKMLRLAEAAAVSLAAGKHKARAHAGTVQFLELAARRIDYLGMKIQFSKEIGDLYRACQADPGNAARVGNNLRHIRGMDGLLPSLRDNIHEVKALYRNAWLAENRPYWLDNVLVRYDAEALEWVRKMRLFDDAASRHDSIRALPDAEIMGLVLP